MSEMGWYVYQRMPKPPRGSGQLRTHGWYRTKEEAEKYMKAGRKAARERNDVVGSWSVGRGPR
jgi:hypothetical protein